MKNPWKKFLVALADSVDGELMVEKANQNTFRQGWLEGEFIVKYSRRSKRFISHRSIIEKVAEFLATVPSVSSVPVFEVDEIFLLELFPESFVSLI